MKHLAWLFRTLLKAAVFFTLFAFTLNNQGDATVHFFFGHQWTGPLILVVLGAFCIGVMVGVVGMVPRWWRQRGQTEAARPPTTPAPAATSSNAPPFPPDGI